MNIIQRSIALRVTALLFILLFATVSAATAQESTPAADRLSVQDQPVAPDGTVVISEVVSSQPGWIVLHRAIAGTLGPIVGIGAVPAGTTEDATTILDLSITTDTILFAALYTDNGEIGVFDYLTVDVPVRSNDELVATRFVVKPAEMTEAVSGGTLVGIDEITETESGPEAETEAEAGQGIVQESDIDDPAVEVIEVVEEVEVGEVVQRAARGRSAAITAVNSDYRSGSSGSGDTYHSNHDHDDHRTSYQHNDFRNSSASHGNPQQACPPVK